jgi:hypothetical protein
LTLDLFPSLLAFKFLSEFFNLFTHALLALLALSLLVHGSALHDSCDDFGGVDVLEFVVSDLAVNVERFGDGVGVVGEGHELGDAMVDSGRGGVGKCEEECFGERERRAKDDGVDVLHVISSLNGVVEISTYFAL